MIDTLMLEKKYYELMGYKNVVEHSDEESGNRWLTFGTYYSILPTICWNTEQATRVMLMHKINVMFYVNGVEAWDNGLFYEADKKFVPYHMDKNTRAYFSDTDVFNVAVLQAAVDLLERSKK